MKVICTTKPDKFKNLTINKEYENVIEDGEAYVVPNDSGFRSRYAKKYFRVVPETPTTQPRPAQPVTRNLLDVLTMNYHENDGGDYLEIILNGISRNININLEISTISCGIYEVYGIQEIKRVVNEMYNNKQQNIVGTREEFFRAVMEYLIAQLRNNNSRAFFLMSDNNNTANSDIYDSILSTLAVGNFSRSNPNSGNNITLWIINGAQ